MRQLLFSPSLSPPDTTIGSIIVFTLMSRNAHNNKIGKITKYRRQFDDFYNFGKYGDCGELLSNHQIYVNQFHTWWPAMLAKLANMAILANSCQITKFM